MQRLKMFLDTHDAQSDTFPKGIDAEQFAAFFTRYQQACEEEGVIIVRVHVGLDDARAFCLNLAPDEGAVRRAHDKVGLKFDQITEVKTATPGDLLFQRQ